MHLCHWKALGSYDGKIGALVRAFMTKYDVKNIPTGRYELEDGCFVNVDEYATRENRSFEVHKKYIDVQLLAEGIEEIFCAELANGKERIAYDEKRDIAFYESEEFDTVRLLPEQAIVLFPKELHAPGNAPTVRQNRKLVFKIPVRLVKSKE